jgi:antitoxin (DNA-binding transcriptional repressor) of toxin-antitoxin stability system
MVMTFITIQDVERDPHGCFQRVEAGETLVVTREQQPVAEIKPVVQKTMQPREFGSCRGQIFISPDFNDPLPDNILREFEGR